MYKAIDKFLDAASEVIHTVAGLCMLLGTAWMFISVILRYGFHINFFWTEEVVRYLMLTGAFWLAGHMMVTDGMVALTVVVDMIKSPKIHRVLSVIRMIVAVVISALMALWSTQLFLAVGGQKTGSLIFPKRLPMSILMIGMIILFIYGLLGLIRMLMAPKNEAQKEANE